jgi:hypothetical protein
VGPRGAAEKTDLQKAAHIDIRSPMTNYYYLLLRRKDGRILSCATNPDVDLIRQSFSQDESPSLEQRSEFKPSLHRIIKKYEEVMIGLIIHSAVNSGLLNAVSDGIAEHYLGNVVAEQGQEIEKLDDEHIIYRMPERSMSRTKTALDELNMHSSYRAGARRSLLVTLTSEFENLLVEIVKYIFYKHPAKIEKSNRQFTAAEILQLGDIDEIKSAVVEQEIESITRESIISAIAAAAQHAGIKFEIQPDIEAKIIEIFERRNIIVHNSGFVNSRYLEKIKQTTARKGQNLDVGQKYFRDACKTLFCIGYNFGQIAWRKIEGDQIEAADSALIATTFNLNLRKEFNMCIELTEHWSKIDSAKYSNEKSAIYIWMNHAVALKNTQNEYAHILSKIDWSSKSDFLQFCKNALLDNTPNCVNSLEKLKQNQDITIEDISIWPIFDNLRANEEFSRAVENVFGEKIFHVA